MAQVVKDIKRWLMQWFYTETEVDGFIGEIQQNKLNKNLGTANQNVVTDGAGNVDVEAKPTIPSASNSTPSADTTSGGTGSSSAFARADHTHPKSSIYAEASHSHGASEVSDSSAYANLGTSANATQQAINSAINTKIGELVGIDFITVVQTLPTASSSTMGKIYLVPISGSGNNNFAEYVTVKQGSSYSWEKLGEISGSGLSVDWSDITNKPNLVQTSSTSGLIKNDGTIDTNTYLTSSSITGKSDKTATIGTTITLVDAGETNEGCIIFNTIS